MKDHIDRWVFDSLAQEDVPLVSGSEKNVPQFMKVEDSSCLVLLNATDYEYEPTITDDKTATSTAIPPAMWAT